MKVRMLFAYEFLPEGAKEVETLKVDSTPDLPDVLAAKLIEEGRAEPVKPAPKKSGKDGE